MDKKHIYPAKILLFGEYTVLHGAQALAIPFFGKAGQWLSVNKVPDQYAKQFNPYLDWLKLHYKSASIDLDQIEKDFSENLIYHSNIPDGYGLGSSGALCAAIYDRYVKKNGQEPDLSQLRKELAGLEGYFHGQSSGIDPFVSYIKQPVLRQRNDQFHIINSLQWPSEINIFLLDSGQPRSTSKWVEIYQQKRKDKGFQIQIERQLIPTVEHAIHFLLSQSWEMFWTNLQTMSEFQSIFFKEMIPETMKHIWDNTLQSNDTHMKLCGAGGGGYFLLFSKNRAKALSQLGDIEYLEVLPGQDYV